jgi:hypothetical protein
VVNRNRKIGCGVPVEIKAFRQHGGRGIDIQGKAGDLLARKLPGMEMSDMMRYRDIGRIVVTGSMRDGIEHGEVKM